MDAFIIRVIKFIISGWLVKKVLSKSDFTNVPIKVVLLSKIGDGG